MKTTILMKILLLLTVLVLCAAIPCNFDENWKLPAQVDLPTTSEVWIYFLLRKDGDNTAAYISSGRIHFCDFHSPVLSPYPVVSGSYEFIDDGLQAVATLTGNNR